MSYHIVIKTAPHNQWHAPQGWDGYKTRAQANAARKRAAELWMEARVVKTAEDGVVSR